MEEASRQQQYQKASIYAVGDYDLRPWGFWAVTMIPGTEPLSACEKVIGVWPGQILSLQSHDLRHEDWTVLDGNLTALVGERCQTLGRGETITVPAGTVHSMANFGDTPCIIKERQTGICRESDIVRYLDANGRMTVGANDQVLKSVQLYLALIQQIKAGKKEHA